MFEWVLFFFILIDVVVCWTSYLKKLDSVKLVSKPLFCLLLIAFVLLSVEPKPYVLFFCAGLFSSFIGDLFLIKEGLEWFACGLVSFLVSHICNIIGYSQTLQIGIFIPSLFVLLIGTITSVPLMQGSKSKTQKLFTLPVHVYSCGLTGGSFFALSTLSSTVGVNWNGVSSVMTAVGYLFFDISDAVLAYNVFVKKSNLTAIIIITTYHIAQLLLMGGLVYNEKYNELLPILI
ncbi:hypothetical protein EIN_411100 [Entamoeba invadens IP1]|uniref:Transmembrane protein 86A n=1 Tax=Entamoeba invadens IP1 TaxID=370355 RepID=A0A0A1U133_ENTIV|nr:hypothetical protein EIN_411100 [Entamoeba invadens IP1]ELP87757.1 hypothetical protein EIN_411100 [Entamoeba invadens IP1]|eukprot:XP_004254528.1 hypothetical protein EIN_411100 [Entamoeba invadens IP1]